MIKDRKQFRDAIVEAKSVSEMSSSKAKDEFNEFLIEGALIMADLDRFKRAREENSFY